MYLQVRACFEICVADVLSQEGDLYALPQRTANTGFKTRPSIYDTIKSGIFNQKISGGPIYPVCSRENINGPLRLIS